MGGKDSYEGLADRYDLFPHNQAAYRFFRNLFEENRVSRVLDCACGTGRDLIVFRKLGCDAVGTDLSESMLARAGKNLAAAQVNVPLHQIDFRELPAHFDQPFDAVACLSGSLMEAADEAEMLSALCSMYAVLRDGGLLILTQGMTDKLWREKWRFILDVNTPDVSRLFVIDYLERGARFNILDISHSDTESGLSVWSVEHPHVLFGDDYRRLLPKAGFSDVQLFGGYGFEAYEPEESGWLIVVARR